jgi:hypothetical protein
MKNSTLRSVVAFYSSEEREQAVRAFEALHVSSGSKCIVRSDADKPPESCRLYAALRIEGETVVVAEAQSPKIGEIVKALRLVGTPTLFVVRPQGLPLRGRDTVPAPIPKTRREILAQLTEGKAVLDSARRDLHEAARLDHALPAAAEWILDNSYLIRTQIAEVRRHLPRGFEAWETKTGPDDGLMSLTQRVAAECDFALTDNKIRDFLRRHQVSTPLTIAELWAFPLFLRIALIEAVTSIAVRVAEAQQLRESAYLWANRLASAIRVGEETFTRFLQLLAAEPLALERHFVAALAEQLQDEEQALGPIQRWIERHFQASITDLARDLHTKEATQTVSIANAFGSLRMLGGLSFTEIFEDVSLVEAELRGDPAGIYARSDFPTRDRCRRVVERIARGCATT